MKLVTSIFTSLALASCAFGAATSTEEQQQQQQQRSNSGMAVAPSSNQGDELAILCKINYDRQLRSHTPVFLHKTLSDVASSLAASYADGSFTDSTFNEQVYYKVRPLGYRASAIYQMQGQFATDADYIQAIEQAVPDAVFDRTLEAIGLYIKDGVYTTVLATGLAAKPKNIEPCPSSRIQFSPPPSSSPSSAPQLSQPPQPPQPPQQQQQQQQPPTSKGNNSVDNGADIINGIDLPGFLCALNKRRINSNLDPFIIQRVLFNEAYEQVKLMNVLGRYTTTRKVDQMIFGHRNVNVSRLSWIAGDDYSDTERLADLITTKYATFTLNSQFSTIGVAQLNGFWSVILAGVNTDIDAEQMVCPLRVEDINVIP